MKYSIFILVLTTILTGTGCMNNKTADNRNPLLSFDIRSIDDRGNYMYEEKIIDPHKVAIVVVDMWQSGGTGYIRRDGSFVGTAEGFLYLDRVSDSLNETLGAARALGFKVVHAPADQVYLYEGHPARENIRRLTHAKYPWQEKPGWNDEQKKIPFASFPFEFEYAYPNTPKERNRPGTKTYGQNPRIVITDKDYITADIEELWDFVKGENIETLIYMGGSTNMCLAGRPYGLLNMKKYGVDVLMDRNYAHLMHRIPHGWNGDTANPKYGPFYTNERNSQQVIEYFEAHICPTLDGMVIREMARSRGGYTIPDQPIQEATPDAMFLKISFQPQLIEIADNYIVDIGWEYGHNPNGLDYGWNRLKVKDGIREGYDPVQYSFIEVRPGDNWKLTGMPDYEAKLELSGTGELLINGVLHKVGAELKDTLSFLGSGSVQLQLKSGELRFYQLEGVKRI